MAADSPAGSPTSPATPLISVIIPVLNGAETLGEQLAALTGEIGSADFEVIIADNGSTDDTCKIGQAFSEALEMKVIDASRRPGCGAARNIGAKSARGSLLVFLDADDRIEHGYLQAMKDSLERFDLVGARIDVVALNPFWPTPPRQVAQTSSLGTGFLPWAYGASLAVRREVFDRIGGFDEAVLPANEDIDFCWRAQLAGATFGYVPDAVLSYRFPTTVRALFRQGRSYGRGVSRSASRYRRYGYRRPPLRAQLVLFPKLVKRLAVGPDRATRANAMFLIARQLGDLRGRFERVHWESLPADWSMENVRPPILKIDEPW